MGGVGRAVAHHFYCWELFSILGLHMVHKCKTNGVNIDLNVCLYWPDFLAYLLKMISAVHVVPVLGHVMKHGVLFFI